MIILGLHPSSSFTLKRSDSSHGHTQKKKKKPSCRWNWFLRAARRLIQVNRIYIVRKPAAEEAAAEDKTATD